MKTVRWKPRKVYAIIGFVSLASIVCALWVSKELEPIFDDIRAWRSSCAITTLIFVGVVIFVYINIALIASEKTSCRTYYLDTERKICIKGRKKIEYESVFVREQTLLQKVFMLVTVELSNKSKTIVLKDIEQEVLDELEGE